MKGIFIVLAIIGVPLWFLISLAGFISACVRLGRAAASDRTRRRRIRMIWAVMLYLSAVMLSFIVIWILAKAGSTGPDPA